jgi:tRNA pseudouridine13 synthase
MKLKQHPEDFQVEELTDVAPGAHGPFAFYRLEKRGWTTPDALQAVRRRWKLEPQRLAYGGLKDRHAHTIQYLTIFRGPRRQLTHHGINVEYLGQVAGPYTSSDIRANRFRITLRAVPPGETDRIRHVLEEIRLDGVPNYFDDQRFGSVAPVARADQPQADFVARLMILERYEDALRLALTAPYEYDRAEQKQEKAVLRAHWGDWPKCKELLPRGHARSLADYLTHHPDDYRGALERLRPELRGLYLSAYQSHLWNKMLARWVEQHCRPDQITPVRLRLGVLPMHRNLSDEQRSELARLQLPLPSARTRLEPGDERQALIDSVLREEGIALPQMKLKGFRKVFFSKGERAALCLPAAFGHEFQHDEEHAGQEKLILAFELPRGSYATLIIKRIQQASGACERPGAGYGR